MTDSNSKKGQNLGPGELSSPGVQGGPPFTLSRTEWISIQTYVTNSLALPTTDEAFKESLGHGASADLSDFGKLISAYAKINQHCTTWQKTTFPASVLLAGDIYEYGMNKVPVYYPAILKEANILVDDPGNETAKKALSAILDNLAKQAQGYETNAKNVAQQIATFAEQTQADKSTLVGPKGGAGLQKYYNDKYGSTSTEVETLTKEIAAQRIVLDAKNKEYDHDVVVAATTPTYAWVFPIGTIAAAVVAGVYGDKAVKALDAARAAQQKINTLSAQLAADANLMMAINSAELGMSSILADLNAALPVIQKIQGVWGGIASDIGGIVKLINTDIREALPIIMNLGVEEATRAWHNVAIAANTYRVNAYVTQK